MRVVELHVGNDQFLIAARELRERGTIPLRRFRVEDTLEWRRGAASHRVLLYRSHAPPHGAAVLVGNAIADRRPKVHGECVAALWLKGIQTRQRAQQRILDQIRRVDGGTHPRRKPAACPPTQAWKIPQHQTCECARITLLRSDEETPRRGAREVCRRRSGCSHGPPACDATPAGKDI